jgi:hypothetical protein
MPQSFAYNDSAGVWAVGYGCGNESKASSDPATFCTQRTLSGVGTVNSLGINVAQFATANYFFCWCRKTWPTQSGWIIVLTVKNEIDESLCAQQCVKNIQGSTNTYPIFSGK